MRRSLDTIIVGPMVRLVDEPRHDEVVAFYFFPTAQWLLVKHVTPAAYAHRLERQLAPVPAGMFPVSVDWRVER